jgi:hypothetical protein
MTRKKYLLAANLPVNKYTGVPDALQLCPSRGMHVDGVQALVPLPKHQHGINIPRLKEHTNHVVPTCEK